MAKPLTDPYPIGNTTITWTATNASGSVTCPQTITVEDKQPPTFTLSPTTDFNFCVSDIQSAVYNPTPTDPNYDDLTTPRPDYYQFTTGNTVFDLDPTANSFFDNCCAVSSLILHWRIDFVALPAQAPPHALYTPASISGTGQPSTHAGFQLPGDGVNYSKVIDKIYYWLEDCTGPPGNLSPEHSRNIIINPRPNIVKTP